MSAPATVLTFVTSNAGKLAEVSAMLRGGPLSVVALPLDLPELQGEPEAVALAKARAAAAAVGGPVLTEDTSLCFNALGGLPGVYIRWFLEKLGHEGLNTLLAGHADKSAFAQCIFAHSAGPGCEPTLFVGRCPGRIVPFAAPPGPAFGWDPIFAPDAACGRTFAQMDKAEKATISHRGQALRLLQAHFAAAAAAAAAAEARGDPPPTLS